MKRNEVLTIVEELKLTEYQTEMLVRHILDILNLNKDAENTYPESCPNCFSKEHTFIKKGVNTGKQRYQCKGCMSVFVWDVNKLTYNSKVSMDKWHILIHDTLCLLPLLKTSANLNLSENTVFRMRHKFLLVLEDLIEDDVLSGVIECDETYILESSKGTKVHDRKPRKRQTPSTKRGLSNEQICVLVATNRLGKEVCRVIDRGKPKSENITTNLEHNIKDQSVVITDKLRSYNELITIKACVHYTLSSHKEYNNLLHLNTVNSIHSKLSKMIQQFRGVATKYLNRYCALLLFIRKFMQMDDGEMMEIMIRKLKKSNHYCKSTLLRNENIVTV
ncbi:MAG TPA: IS1595 family transposase [Erysipelothrix sp.]|nr:IS1595 family transposase [Erysipelothrix sp.]